MAKFTDMSIEAIKRYISAESDNIVDEEEYEELADIVDRLDNQKSKNRSMPFSKYFGEMDLTKKQKEDRENFSKDLKEVLAVVLSLIELAEKYQAVNELMIVNQLAYEYQRVASNYMDDVDADWLSEYVVAYSTDFVSTSLAHSSDKWYTSDDRLTFNAENEANTILNRAEFTEAKKRGFFHKQWITMEDARVRSSHKRVDKQIIPIDDFFQVGEAQMLYPKDIVNASDHPEETVNCRCSIRYIT